MYLPWILGYFLFITMQLTHQENPDYGAGPK